MSNLLDGVETKVIYNRGQRTYSFGKFGSVGEAGRLVLPVPIAEKALKDYPKDLIDPSEFSSPSSGAAKENADLKTQVKALQSENDELKAQNAKLQKDLDDMIKLAEAEGGPVDESDGAGTSGAGTSGQSGTVSGQ